MDQSILGLLAFDHAAELEANLAQQREQCRVEFLFLVREELHHCSHVAPDEDRKSHAAVDAARGNRASARKIPVGGQVLQPGRRCRGEDPTGKPFAGSE